MSDTKSFVSKCLYHGFETERKIMRLVLSSSCINRLNLCESTGSHIWIGERHLLRNTLTKKEKKKIRKFKHPLQAACEYQEKVLRKLDENFRKRTTYSHLLVHKSNGSRLEDDVMFLERECRKSLTDAMFQIQFKSVLELHHKHQNQRKKRPPHTKATRRAAKDLAYRYQDRNLRCFPEPFADPPIASKCPPWAGFWLRENMYRPKFWFGISLSHYDYSSIRTFFRRLPLWSLLLKIKTFRRKAFTSQKVFVSWMLPPPYLNYPQSTPYPQIPPLSTLQIYFHINRSLPHIQVWAHHIK